MHIDDLAKTHADSKIFVNVVTPAPQGIMNIEPGMQIRFNNCDFNFTTVVNQVYVSHGAWHLKLDNSNTPDLMRDEEGRWAETKNPDLSYSATILNRAENLEYTKGTPYCVTVPKNHTKTGIGRHISSGTPIDWSLKVVTQLSQNPYYGTFFEDPVTYLLYFGRSGGTRIYPPLDNATSR